MTIKRRIAALEGRSGADVEPIEIIFSLAGATDADIIGINNGFGVIKREPGEAVSDLVRRAKASAGISFGMPTIMSFQYRPEARA
jgi:hypothetical protein